MLGNGAEELLNTDRKFISADMPTPNCGEGTIINIELGTHYYL